MTTYKKLLYTTGFITVFIFGSLQLYFYLFPTTIEEDNKFLLSKIREREIKSIVKNKSIDNYKRRTIFIIYNKDSLSINEIWEEKINIGDSIMKPKGSIEFIIKNEFKADTLNYIDIVNDISTVDF